MLPNRLCCLERVLYFYARNTEQQVRLQQETTPLTLAFVAVLITLLVGRLRLAGEVVDELLHIGGRN